MSSRYLRYAWSLIGGVILAGPSQSQTPKSPGFEADVLPLLRSRCVECHGNKIQARELNLSTAEGVGKGSESGPVVVAGNPKTSLLYKVLHEGRMPPARKDRLTDNQIALIRDWIAAGASFGKPETVKAISFETEILPFLRRSCGGCHGGKSPKRDLDLTTVAGVIKGSDSGEVVT